jgi:hypothetical protein
MYLLLCVYIYVVYLSSIATTVIVPINQADANRESGMLVIWKILSLKAATDMYLWLSHTFYSPSPLENPQTSDNKKMSTNHKITLKKIT